MHVRGTCLEVCSACAKGLQYGQHRIVDDASDHVVHDAQDDVHVGGTRKHTAEDSASSGRACKAARVSDISTSKAGDDSVSSGSTAGSGSSAGGSSSAVAMAANSKSSASAKPSCTSNGGKVAGKLSQVTVKVAAKRATC